MYKIGYPTSLMYNQFIFFFPHRFCRRFWMMWRWGPHVMEWGPLSLLPSLPTPQPANLVAVNLIVVIGLPCSTATARIGHSVLAPLRPRTATTSSHCLAHWKRRRKDRGEEKSAMVTHRRIEHWYPQITYVLLNRARPPSNRSEEEVEGARRSILYHHGRNLARRSIPGPPWPELGTPSHHPGTPPATHK